MLRLPRRVRAARRPVCWTPTGSAPHPSSGWLAGLCLVLGVAGCAAPEAVPRVPTRTWDGGRATSQEPRTLRSAATPDWRFQPLSWNKLETIEAWLDGDGRWAGGEQRDEARLILAEGRLTFARRDAGRVSAAVLASRLESAERGFEQVAHSRTASPAHRRRAQNALRDLAGLAPAAPVALRVVSRAQWRATPAIPARLTAGTGRWDRLTVHHSAEYAGLLRRGGVSEAARAVQSIQRYHVESKEYGDIAYHFLVDPAGNVFEGRSLRWQGAHAGGSNNVRNIGVCLLGDFDREAPTPAALAALERLVGSLRSTYGIAAGRIYGHDELRTTACPGRYLRSWLARFRSRGASGGSVAAR